MHCLVSILDIALKYVILHARLLIILEKCVGMCVLWMRHLCFAYFASSACALCTCCASLGDAFVLLLVLNYGLLIYSTLCAGVPRLINLMLPLPALLSMKCVCFFVWCFWLRLCSLCFLWNMFDVFGCVFARFAFCGICLFWCVIRLILSLLALLSVMRLSFVFAIFDVVVGFWCLNCEYKFKFARCIG